MTARHRRVVAHNINTDFHGRLPIGGSFRKHPYLLDKSSPTGEIFLGIFLNFHYFVIYWCCAEMSSTDLHKKSNIAGDQADYWQVVRPAYNLQLTFVSRLGEVFVLLFDVASSGGCQYLDKNEAKYNSSECPSYSPNGYLKLDLNQRYLGMSHQHGDLPSNHLWRHHYFEWHSWLNCSHHSNLRALKDFQSNLSFVFWTSKLTVEIVTVRWIEVLIRFIILRAFPSTALLIWIKIAKKKRADFRLTLLDSVYELIKRTFDTAGTWVVFL